VLAVKSTWLSYSDFWYGGTGFVLYSVLLLRIYSSKNISKKKKYMKVVLIFLAGCLIAITTFAQNVSNVVTIKVNSNRAQAVLVDGRSYALTNENNSTPNTTGYNIFTITDLQPGQHELQVVRNQNNTNNNGVRRNNTNTFVLRARYDLAITVNNNGTIELKETRNRNRGNVINQYRTPMTDANFNSLLSTIQRQSRANAKRTAITNAFTNENNYFTTSQAMQLIKLVSSESNRLELAKSAYPRITDPANATQLYALFNNQSNRDALSAYITSYNNNNSGYSNNGNGYNNNSNQHKIAMTDANFNVIMQNVKKQWLPGAKMSALADAFNNTSNYFTTSQAKQLIQLVSDEDNRLQLAKLAYPRMTDPANANQLYDLFTSQSNRDALSAYITSYNNNAGYSNNGNGYNNNSNQYKTAMTDANFNVIMQDVKKQWLPGGKMSALADAFNNTSNYFTTYQAKQLIQLVSDEDNRLQLAKSAYRNIVDPSNFTQLYDLFTTQARKDALANYISSYSYNRQ
jgi:hypothetical protein